MSSRLNRITDWEGFARSAGYRVTALAERARISPQRLRLHFLQRFGMSTKTWLLELGKRDALICRQQGKLVKEIASDLGFKEPSSYCRFFKRGSGAADSDIFHTATEKQSLSKAAVARAAYSRTNHAAQLHLPGLTSVPAKDSEPPPGWPTVDGRFEKGNKGSKKIIHLARQPAIMSI